MEQTLTLSEQEIISFKNLKNFKYDIYDFLPLSTQFKLWQNRLILDLYDLKKKLNDPKID